MPIPSPTPTATELTIAAEIAMLSVDVMTELVASDTSQDVSNAKWARTLVQIAAWDAIATDAGDIKRVGEIEFFEGKAISGRLDFRNILRARYGYELLTSENAPSLLSISSLAWFY